MADRHNRRRLLDMPPSVRGGNLPAQSDILRKLIDPAIEPRDFAHPHNADNFLDLADIVLKPSLSGFKSGLSGLDGVHLGQQLQQQGLQVVHGAIVPQVEPASYTSAALAVHSVPARHRQCRRAFIHG